MLSDIPENAPSETLFSFYDTPFRRPYQAYCVTEASSRPPSPDPLVQEPFCASAPPLWPAADRAHFTDTERFEQNNSFIQAAASSPEQYVESVTLSKVEQYSKRQTSPPNGKLLCERTGSGKDPNHITRAVSPRGSHLLASSEVVAYDQPPSHAQLRQLEPSTRTDTRSVSRRPMEHGNRMGTHQRPLPPLPLGTGSLRSVPNQQDDTWNKEAYKEVYEQFHTQKIIPLSKLSSSNTETLPRWKSAEYLIPRRSLPDPPIPCVWSRGTAPEGKITPLSSTGHPYVATVCESSRNLWERSISSDYAQNRPSARQNISRGHWEDIDNDVRALQQVQDEHASQGYNSGRLPSHKLALPSLISQQRDSSLQPVHFLANPAPSFHSSSDIQNGPRPPPWGSYEDLEIQRRQRGDARERTNVQLNRLTADSASMYQKSISSESVGKVPSREVEQYREQILGVYPDMEFNRDDGLGDPMWCCCVVM